MAKYQRIVTTEAGLQLLASAVAGGTVTFTAIKTGSGTYAGTENLPAMTDLKSVRQTFGVSSITRTGTQVKLRSVLNNDNLTEGYSMTEIGLYAKDLDTGSDFLYAIIVAETGFADYLPAYELAPTSMTLELYLELTETESDVTFAAEVIEGTYVPVESFNDHVTDNIIHITPAERTTWNAKLGTTGNVSNTTATFTEATTLAALATGSKLSVLFGGVAKAVSSLISHLANTSNPHSVTKTQVGLGNVDNTSDANKPVSTATQAELNKKAQAADLTAHTGSTSNPHSVTKAQVGLGSVPNVATNDQTPTYTAATLNAALVSGEKLSVAFGKLSMAVSSLISHLADSVSHITAAERTAWNAKLDKTATAADSDKVDGKHANDFLTRSSGRVDKIGFDSANSLHLLIDGNVYKLPFGYGQDEIKKYFPLTGGTVSGNITFDMALGAKALFGIDAGIKCPIMMHLVDTGDTCLFLNSPDAELQQAIRLRITNGEHIAVYSVFGQHNKPINTYTGNGTIRTIYTNGIGDVVVIYGDNAYNAIVTPHGAMCFFGSTMQGFGSDSIKFADGVLTVGTANPASAYFNQNDIEYRYQVL